jgi:hypothetical protein
MNTTLISEIDRKISELNRNWVRRFFSDEELNNLQEDPELLRVKINSVNTFYVFNLGFSILITGFLFVLLYRHTLGILEFDISRGGIGFVTLMTISSLIHTFRSKWKLRKLEMIDFLTRLKS